MAGHDYSIGSLLAPKETRNANNNTVADAPQETQTDKLKKGNVWDYAASMQAGAFQG